ncbi:hypothetical protein [Mycolicibacterium sediminis]|uniref:NfeD-like C-terminal domain-containing protein n=1 Tax=Mycolicibacterium sediminis TaxID=1286180 RepID=A0A7I7QPY9_9MYCO|nr:hypothetical protein [Mycolicibacterium sediminis]BBY28345.1 hypothetical protein MSEDJ_24410 [Mycolicibacterium sediminis]
MTAVYLVAFVVGAIAVLASLLLTEVDVGGGHGIGHATGDGMPFLSLTSLSAAVLGAGTGGLVSTWAGLGTVPAAIVAAASAAVLLGLLQGVALPYLRRQQSNSHRSRSSYVGLLGTVTLEIPPDGWGEVSFVDADGNRVRSRAVSDEPSALAKSTRIYVSDLDGDAVRVVAVPDSELPHNEGF